MSTYGTRDATQFPLPTVEKGARFYTLIDSTTNEITLKKIDSGNIFGRTDLDITVGTVPTSGANAGKFIQNPNLGLTADQKAALQDSQTLKTVKDKGIETVSKALQKSGKTPEESQATANKLLSQNKATNPTAESVDATDIAKDIIAKGRNTAGTYGNLVYPLDIKTTAQDVIRFTILTFLPTGLNIAEALKGKGALGSRPQDIKNRNILGSIILPIPGNISDTNNCNWGDDRLDAFSAVALNTALTTIQKGFGEGAKVIGETASAAMQTSDTSQGLAAAIAAQAAGGTATKILGRTQGAVFNENLELLFSGPELRSFSFTFKMSARSKPEADEIVKIIRAFKQSMSAQTTSSTIFLKAPNTYKIEYLRRQKNGKEGTEIVHTRLGKIKECALLSLTTNYAPEGQYAVYNDGTPISYEIQMQFKELEPIFNDDYGNVTENIGF